MTRRTTITIPFAYDGRDPIEGHPVRMLGTTEVVLPDARSEDMPRVELPVGDNGAYVSYAHSRGRIVQDAFPESGDSPSSEEFSERMRSAARATISFNDQPTGDLATLPWIDARLTPKGVARPSIAEAIDHAAAEARSRLVVVDGTVRRTDCDTSIVVARTGTYGLGTVVPISGGALSIVTETEGHWLDLTDAAGLRILGVPPVRGEVEGLTKNAVSSCATAAATRLRRTLEVANGFLGRAVAQEIRSRCRSEVARFLRGDISDGTHMNGLEDDLLDSIRIATQEGGRPGPGRTVEDCKLDRALMISLGDKRQAEFVGSPEDSPQLRRGKGPSAMALHLRP